MNREATPDLVLGFLQLVEPMTVWLDGGWGVDALLGRQTRCHGDLDVIVADRQMAMLRQRLEDADYRPDAAADGCVYVAPEGLQVDIHPVRFDDRGYGSFPLPDGGEWPMPPSAFAGRGRIDGRDVSCLSAEAQVQCHAQGYPPAAKDLADMRALQEQFGVVLPLVFCRRPDREG